MIPAYLVDASVWWSLVPIPGLGVLCFGCLYFVLRRNRSPRECFLVALPLVAFLVLGTVAGYLTGLSREAAVGAVVPAALSLLGGLAVLQLGKAADGPGAVRLSGSVLAFAVGLLIGTTWGSSARQTAVDFEISELERMRRAHVELRVREFREGVGLPLNVPSDDGTPNLKPHKGAK